MRALMHLLTKLGPMYLMDPRTGQDVVGGYGGTLEGGATANVEMPGIKGGGRAISLDGTNDYVSTTATTRRNLCTNPRAAVDVTGIIGTSLASGPTKATMPTTGGLPTSLPTTGVNIVGNAADDRASWSVAVTSGTAYTFSVYVRLSANTATGVVARINNAGGTQKAVSSTLSATGGNFTRLTATVTADATETWTFDVRQLGAGGITADYTAGLIEAASSAGDYFDGSGHVNASGTWVSDGLTGWLGTAHASASDCGVFANGTTRTFVMAFDADAIDTRNPIGGDSVALQLLSNGAVAFYPDAATAAFPANAGSIAVDTPTVLAVEFNEPSNALSGWVNGVAETPTTNAGQYAARDSLDIGTYANGTQLFDGLIGPVAIFDRALTAEEHHEIEKTGLAGRFG